LRDAAWLNDAFQQLRMVGLSDLSATETAFPRLPRVHAERMARSSVWRKDFPTEFFSALTIFAVAKRSLRAEYEKLGIVRIGTRNLGTSELCVRLYLRKRGIS
jgi:hypothetical protein